MTKQFKVSGFDVSGFIMPDNGFGLGEGCLTDAQY